MRRVGAVHTRRPPPSKRSVVLRSPGKLAAALALSGLVAASSSAHAGESVALLVLKEEGVGSAAQAQSYVDRLVAVAAQHNGWSAATGSYQTKRAAAETWIASASPHYGIMSLGAFLALRARHGLEVVGKAEVVAAGGREYHVVSSSAKSLAECKQQKLATNHARDPRFVEAVVADGAFVLGDFQVVETKRPMQPIQAVVRGEATCALVDDAQVAEMKKVEGGATLASVWKSAPLPPMAVVAFRTAPAAEKAAFKKSLSKLCAGDGAAVCREVGIRSLAPADAADYRSVVAKYGD